MWDTASPGFSSCHHLIGSGIRSQGVEKKALKVRSEMIPFATFALSPVSAMAPCPLRRAALEQEGLKRAHVVSWRSTYWGCLGTPLIAPDLSWSAASLNAEPKPLTCSELTQPSPLRPHPLHTLSFFFFLQLPVFSLASPSALNALSDQLLSDHQGVAETALSPSDGAKHLHFWAGRGWYLSYACREWQLLLFPYFQSLSPKLPKPQATLLLYPIDTWAPCFPWRQIWICPPSPHSAALWISLLFTANPGISAFGFHVN